MLWAGKSATEIAAAVRQGKVTATAVIEEHLRVIAERDPRVGAFRLVRREALEEARAVQRRRDLADLPLAGVPVAVKDNVEVAGEATRIGSAVTGDAPAAEDHATVARLRAAGAVVIGLTNLPELGLVAFGDSAYGTVRNPWDRSRTAGGSSSGSAAAVAAGMVPIALGNDGMGSLRIPAACCGVLAVKPGTGLVPPPSDAWQGLSENGPIATVAADLSLMLSVLAADPSLAEAWRGGCRLEPRRRDAPLGLGGRRRRGLGAAGRHRTAPSRSTCASPTPRSPCPPACRWTRSFRRRYAAAAETLRVAGHTIVERDTRLPTWLGPATIATWLTRAGEAADGLDRWRLERRSRALARGDGCSPGLGPGRRAGPGPVERLRRRPVVRRRRRAHHPGAGGDPAQGRRLERARPAPQRCWATSATPRDRRLEHVRLARSCTVPIATHSSGLPIGVQLIAPPGGEPHLLGLAAQLQTAHPPIRPPGFSV